MDTVVEEWAVTVEEEDLLVADLGSEADLAEGVSNSASRLSACN